jgi:predicted membrane-bound spermidine synthase
MPVITMSQANQRILLYSLVIFISSALLLVQEIVAGRLIAPYVGVSLYTWTAVVGVILAGMSLGNWLGGVWADRGAGERAAGSVLLGAALASLAIPWLLTLIAPGVQQAELSLLSASLLLVLGLFFIPAVLLGVVTPLLTTLALKLSDRTGHIVGRMHALAALGSILGTFLAGYWLIQALGSMKVILLTALLLFLLALPLLRRQGGIAIGAALLLASMLGLMTQLRGGYSQYCDDESAYFCLRVVSEEWQLPAGEVRSLILDHLLHGANHASEPTLLVSPYVQLMDELVVRQFPEERALDYFFIGGGAYTQPRAALARNAGHRVTVAELDPAVTRMAQQRLFVDTKAMQIHHLDARVLLSRQSGHRYDVIVGDAFHDIAIPYHLITLEFAELVRQHLKPDGIYTINVVDTFPGGQLVRAMVKTLQQAFPSVQVWLDRLPEENARVTYVISAALEQPGPAMITASRGLPGRWFNITEPLLQTGTPLAQLPLLTDDHAPVERLMADLFLTPAGQ